MIENTNKKADMAVSSAGLLSFLEARKGDQKAKCQLKRREQRDAELIAGMHEECSYVIDDIIDKVRAMVAKQKEQLDKDNAGSSPAA